MDKKMEDNAFDAIGDAATKEALALRKINSEIARTEAETQSALADAEEARANTRKALAEANAKEAEAAKALLEAEELKYDIISTKLHTEEQEREAKEKLAHNRYHHVYNFTSAVEASSVQALMNEMNIWMRNDPGCDIEIVFSSPGGSVIDGMALYDYIQKAKSAGHKVTTGAIGYAASMAGILLQAGHTRWMGREAYILIHEVSFGAGGKMGEVEDEVKFVKKIQERVLNIFEDRSQKAGKAGTAKNPLSKSQFKQKWERKDWWLDSQEALDHGIVDEVR